MGKYFLLFLRMVVTRMVTRMVATPLRVSDSLMPCIYLYLNVFPSFRIEPDILSTCLLDNSFYAGFGELEPISLTVIVSFYLPNETFTGILRERQRTDNTSTYHQIFLVDIMTSNKALQTYLDSPLKKLFRNSRNKIRLLPTKFK